MTAHAVVLSYGPATAVICPDCRLNDRYPRTRPAQEAARHHNQTEKVFKCPAKGCASMVPASGQAEHKKGHSDRAALDNQIRQFLTRFGGDYLAEQFHRISLEVRGDGTDAHPGLIPDVDDLLTRVDKLENAPTATPTGTGVQIDTWDDPDLTNELENITTLPRINPLTGLPE